MHTKEIGRGSGWGGWVKNNRLKPFYSHSSSGWGGILMTPWEQKTHACVQWRRGVTRTCAFPRETTGKLESWTQCQQSATRLTDCASCLKASIRDWSLADPRELREIQRDPKR